MSETEIVDLETGGEQTPKKEEFKLSKFIQNNYKDFLYKLFLLFVFLILKSEERSLNLRGQRGQALLVTPTIVGSHLINLSKKD